MISSLKKVAFELISIDFLNFDFSTVEEENVFSSVVDGKTI